MIHCYVNVRLREKRSYGQMKNINSCPWPLPYQKVNYVKTTQTAYYLGLVYDVHMY